MKRISYFKPAWDFLNDHVAFSKKHEYEPVRMFTEEEMDAMDDDALYGLFKDRTKSEEIEERKKDVKFYESLGEARQIIEQHINSTSYFEELFCIEVVRVNPKTGMIDDVNEFNTETRVWTSISATMKEEEWYTNDPIYGSGETFEESVIDLANNVVVELPDETKETFEVMRYHAGQSYVDSLFCESNMKSVQYEESESRKEVNRLQEYHDKLSERMNVLHDNNKESIGEYIELKYEIETLEEELQSEKNKLAIAIMHNA